MCIDCVDCFEVGIGCVVYDVGGSVGYGGRVVGIKMLLCWLLLCVVKLFVSLVVYNWLFVVCIVLVIVLVMCCMCGDWCMFG